MGVEVRLTVHTTQKITFVQPAKATTIPEGIQNNSTFPGERGRRLETTEHTRNRQGSIE